MYVLLHLRYERSLIYTSLLNFKIKSKTIFGTHKKNLEPSIWNLNK